MTGTKTTQHVYAEPSDEQLQAVVEQRATQEKDLGGEQSSPSAEVVRAAQAHVDAVEANDLALGDLLDAETPDDDERARDRQKITAKAVDDTFDLLTLALDVEVVLGAASAASRSGEAATPEGKSLGDEPGGSSSAEVDHLALERNAILALNTLVARFTVDGRIAQFIHTYRRLPGTEYGLLHNPDDCATCAEVRCIGDALNAYHALASATSSGPQAATPDEPETSDTVRAFLREHGRPDLADEIQAGIDREAELRAALAAAIQERGEWAGWIQEAAKEQVRADAAEARVATLEAALREIAETTWPEALPGGWTVVDCLRNRARLVLAEHDA